VAKVYSKSVDLAYDIFPMASETHLEWMSLADLDAPEKAAIPPVNLCFFKALGHTA
tara:strand:- start:1672 stop:1839 length:168 start_codon:yes stop_codon:yes gene_type:complete